MQLVFVYDRVEPQDSCPLFDVRIATVEIDSLPLENLECLKHELPPRKLDIRDAVYRLDQTYSFSSEYLSEFANEE
jgi:hypothetical protein